MYAIAARLDPDSYLALARAVYAEMALAGITCVGEFHYLHHGTGGRRYADPNEMGKALLEAARQAGIRITLLDTCYLSGGLDASGAPVPLAGPQLRFSDGDGHGWAERVAALGAGEHGELGPGARLGAAVHSVRAVPPDQLPPVLAWAQPHGAPVHVHLSEQPAENEACLAAYGDTPAGLLSATGVLGPRATAVHATHLTAEDRRCSATAGAFVCFCPTTERGPGRRDRAGPRAGRRGRPAVPGLGQPRGDRPVRGGARGRAGRAAATGQRGHFTAAELAGAATVGRARRAGLARRRRAGRRGAGRPGHRGLGGPRLAGTHGRDRAGERAVRGDRRGRDDVVVGGRDVVSGGRHLLAGDVPGALDAALAALR